jgi:hypothetical protein
MLVPSSVECGKLTPGIFSTDAGIRSRFSNKSQPFDDRDNLLGHNDCSWIAANLDMILSPEIEH